MTYVKPLPFGQVHSRDVVDNAQFLWMNEAMRGLTSHIEK